MTARVEQRLETLSSRQLSTALSSIASALGELPLDLEDTARREPDTILKSWAALDAPSAEPSDVEGALRAALLLAAERIGEERVSRALDEAQALDHRAFDPITITAVLVTSVLLLDSNISFGRNTDGRYWFRYVKRPSSKSLIAKALSALGVSK